MGQPHFLLLPSKSPSITLLEKVTSRSGGILSNRTESVPSRDPAHDTDLRSITAYSEGQRWKKPRHIATRHRHKNRRTEGTDAFICEPSGNLRANSQIAGRANVNRLGSFGSSVTTHQRIRGLSPPFASSTTSGLPLRYPLCALVYFRTQRPGVPTSISSPALSCGTLRLPESFTASDPCAFQATDTNQPV